MLILEVKCLAVCFTYNTCYLNRPLFFLKYLTQQTKMTANILPQFVRIYSWRTLSWRRFSRIVIRYWIVSCMEIRIKNISQWTMVPVVVTREISLWSVLAFCQQKILRQMYESTHVRAGQIEIGQGPRSCYKEGVASFSGLMSMTAPLAHIRYLARRTASGQKTRCVSFRHHGWG